MRTPGQTLLAVLLLAALSVASNAQTGAKPKRVLLLFQAESHSWPQPIVEESLRSTLENGAPAPILFFSEYLDSGRTKADDHEKELVALLRLKYQGIKFDLIVAILTHP